jgi:hypothetical protein
MRIIINHLTRMQRGYFCVAGIEEGTNRHVRPVLGGARLGVHLLARYGGPFDNAMLVDLGPVAPVGHPPEMEDHQFTPASAAPAGSVPPQQFWSVLKGVAQPRLSTIFGPDPIQRGRASAAVDVGRGSASLGCLSPNGRPILSLRANPARGRDEIRLNVSDGVFSLDLGVTDIRLYKSDHVTPDPSVVQAVNQRMARGVEVIVAVGLGRAIASEGFSPVHWLQVNNLHMADDPTWRLG